MLVGFLSVFTLTLGFGFKVGIKKLMEGYMLFGIGGRLSIIRIKRIDDNQHPSSIYDEPNGVL